MNANTIVSTGALAPNQSFANLAKESEVVVEIAVVPEMIPLPPKVTDVLSDEENDSEDYDYSYEDKQWGDEDSEDDDYRIIRKFRKFLKSKKK